MVIVTYLLMKNWGDNEWNAYPAEKPTCEQQQRDFEIFEVYK